MDESSRRAMAGEQVTEESTAHFYSWLDDPRDRRAKERALDIIMEGCSDDRYSCEGLTGGRPSVRTFNGNVLNDNIFNDNTFNDNTHTTINILFN